MHEINIPDNSFNIIFINYILFFLLFSRVVVDDLKLLLRIFFQYQIISEFLKFNRKNNSDMLMESY